MSTATSTRRTFPDRRTIADDVRDRIEELHALGCTDRDMSKLLSSHPSHQAIRQIRIYMKLPINNYKPRKFSGICINCQRPCSDDRPFCGRCRMSMTWDDYKRLREESRFGTRLSAENLSMAVLESPEASDRRIGERMADRPRKSGRFTCRHGR